MMEENSDIFLAGGNALWHLAKPMHKKYSTKFVWGHPFSTYVSFDLFFNYHRPVRSLDDHFSSYVPPVTSIPPVTYRIDGLFLNQKTNNNIQLSYLLKYKHSKKHKFLKSYTCPKIFHLISVTLSCINGTIIVHFKSYLSQCF